jgi:GNAT superfamily N-acetyltransferase
VFSLARTTGSDPRLPALIAELDSDLRSRYGATQALYAPLNHVKDDAPFVLALDADGTPLGCGSFRPLDTASIEVKRMFVATAARRRGIASAVLGELETWAREQGYTTVLLETGDRQNEAIALYERCGYARTEAFGPYVGLPVSVCMRKAL